MHLRACILKCNILTIYFPNDNLEVETLPHYISVCEYLQVFPHIRIKTFSKYSYVGLMHNLITENVRFISIIYELCVCV